MSTVVFSGGVGGARFLSGLMQVLPQDEITVISNTGDDSIFYGLTVCPDIDSVLYTLSDLVNEQSGWGRANDTFEALSELSLLGCETWFNLGDRDLATHILRTKWLHEGLPLSEVTRLLAQKRGLSLSVLPMTNERVETTFVTDSGHFTFQEYMVKHRFEPQVQTIIFKGIASANPAPHVLEAISSAERIILAPSNPLISIAPILAVDGIRDALLHSGAVVAAVSPLVAGRAIKGPAAILMKHLGMEADALGVARYYQDILHLMIIDRLDESLLSPIRALGVQAFSADTIMDSLKKKKNLASFVLDKMSEIRS